MSSGFPASRAMWREKGDTVRCAILMRVFRMIHSWNDSLKTFAYLKLLTGFVFLTLLVAPSSLGQTIAPASGKAMCSALTPDDFTKAGVPVSRFQGASLDDNKSVYCVYDGKAGKVEMDVFFPAGDTPAEAQNAYRAAQSAIGGKFEPVGVAGADEAASNVSSRKGTDEGSVVVRRGTTVFNLSIPHSSHTQPQLVKLSEVVISRLKQ